MMKKYLQCLVLAVAFMADPAHSNGQLSETHRLLYKASFLQGSSKISNNEAKDIYDWLLAKEPTNAIVYAESGFFHLNHGDKELGMVDLNVAMYLLEKKLCTCDHERLYNVKKEPFFCSLEILEKIYDEKRRMFTEQKKMDSSLHYINKLIGLYTDSSGSRPDYLKFKKKEDALNKLNSMYDASAEVYGSLQRYRDALNSYQKITPTVFYKKRHTDLIDLYNIVGDYDSVLHIMKQHLFIKTDSGLRFTSEYDILAPRYFFDYLSAYMAKREFETAFALLKNNSTFGPVPDTKGENGNLLLKNFPMYIKGESKNICDRIDPKKIEYSYFHFYACILNDLLNKNYESALVHLTDFSKKMEVKFLRLENAKVEYFTGASFQFDYFIYSLKGYLLSKLNKKSEAKQAYQQAIKMNPACREAQEELKNLGN